MHLKYTFDKGLWFLILHDFLDIGGYNVSCYYLFITSHPLCMWWLKLCNHDHTVVRTNRLVYVHWAPVGEANLNKILTWQEKAVPSGAVELDSVHIGERTKGHSFCKQCLQDLPFMKTRSSSTNLSRVQIMGMKFISLY